jgi:hypothetical protein
MTPRTLVAHSHLCHQCLAIIVVVAPSSARCDRLGRGTRATSNIKMSIQTGDNEIVEELILTQDYGYICVRAPLQLSHRGVGGVGKGVVPSHSENFYRRSHLIPASVWVPHSLCNCLSTEFGILLVARELVQACPPQLRKVPKTQESARSTRN